MELPAKDVTNFFGFDQLLPTGRQNTFHNMITLIQSQLQRLNNTGNTNPDMQVNTGSITEQHIQSCGELLSSASSGNAHAFPHCSVINNVSLPIIPSLFISSK